MSPFPSFSSHRWHVLKTLPKWFWPAAAGVKTAEIRQMDRDFRPGDGLVLAEWDGERFTGWIAGFVLVGIITDAPSLSSGFGLLSVSAVGFPRQINDQELRHWLDLSLEPLP